MFRPMHVLCLVGAMSGAACSQVSPAAPTAGGTPAEATLEGRAPSAPSGFYTMSFLHSGQPVTTLPAGPTGSNVLVKVHVEDVNHQPAQSGSVLFEVCKYKSTGKGAPSAACADGTARWSRLVDVGLNSNGDTFSGVDFVLNPCTMGWRATYRRSQTIAPATMGPVDFIWT